MLNKYSYVIAWTCHIFHVIKSQGKIISNFQSNYLQYCLRDRKISHCQTCAYISRKWEQVRVC